VDFRSRLQKLDERRLRIPAMSPTDSEMMMSLTLMPMRKSMRRCAASTCRPADRIRILCLICSIAAARI
jgi:hypothetical protein